MDKGALGSRYGTVTSLETGRSAGGQRYAERHGFVDHAIDKEIFGARVDEAIHEVRHAERHNRRYGVTEIRNDVHVMVPHV